MQELGNTHDIFVLATLLSSLLAQHAVLVVSLGRQSKTAQTDKLQNYCLLGQFSILALVQFTIAIVLLLSTIVEQLLPTRAIAQISTSFVLQMFEQSTKDSECWCCKPLASKRIWWSRSTTPSKRIYPSLVNNEFFYKLRQSWGIN